MSMSICRVPSSVGSGCWRWSASTECRLIEPVSNGIRRPVCVFDMLIHSRAPAPPAASVYSSRYVRRVCVLQPPSQ